MSKLLINSDLNTAGVYKAILLEENKVYIPGITNFSLSGTNNDVDMKLYEEHKDALPTAYFSAFCKKCTENDIPSSCWVAFEGGDVKRPIIMGFQGKSIKLASGFSSNGGYIDGGLDFEMSNVTKNIVFQGHGSNEPITELILHSIAGPSEDTNAIIKTLQDKELGIHAIISNSGVTQCAEWNTIQYHCPGHNSHSIGCEQLESRFITWNQKTWIPSWSSANDAAVKAYHEGVYKNAVELYAQLIVKFGLDVNAIKSHKEAAGNHGDPESLWDQFKAKWNDNKWTMSEFRKNVGVKAEEIKKKLSEDIVEGITIEYLQQNCKTRQQYLDLVMPIFKRYCASNKNGIVLKYPGVLVLQPYFEVSAQFPQKLSTVAREDNNLGGLKYSSKIPGATVGSKVPSNETGGNYCRFKDVSSYYYAQVWNATTSTYTKAYMNQLSVEQFTDAFLNIWVGHSGHYGKELLKEYKKYNLSTYEN